MNPLLISLLFSSVSAAQLGCIREHNTNYGGDNMIEQATSENAQACADHCASIEEGLFWTFQNKTCTVRNSTPSRGGAWHTMSGNRQCGKFPMRGWPFEETVGKPLFQAVKIGSQRPVNFSPEQCADNSHDTVCTVEASPAPWLALDFGSRTQVNRVDLRMTKNSGNRLWDFEVRVTDTLPASGDFFIHIRPLGICAKIDNFFQLRRCSKMEHFWDSKMEHFWDLTLVDLQRGRESRLNIHHLDHSLRAAMSFSSRTKTKC